MAYSLVQGDLLPDMLLTVLAPGAKAALLGNTLLQLVWTKPDGTTSRVPLVLVNATSTTGNVKKVWSTGETAMVGTHLGMIEIYDANGRLASDPNDGSEIIWNVYPRPG
jgi:hypothetical protein